MPYQRTLGRRSLFEDRPPLAPSGNLGIACQYQPTHLRGGLMATLTSSLNDRPNIVVVADRVFFGPERGDTERHQGHREPTPNALLVS